MSSCKKNSITHAAAAPSNLDAASTMRFAASRHKTCTWQRQMTTIMQPFQCDLQPQIQETQRNTHAGTTTRCRTQRRNQNNRSRSRRTHEVPFIAGCNHFTRKNARFRAPASSATQCPMQHSCSHYNAFCSMTWLTRMHLRTWHHQMRTIMQPFQCDLQPQIQETHRITHTGTTTRCRTQRRNQVADETTHPHPPHTGGAFHRRLQPLYTEKRSVSCSSFLPNTMPHATFMQPPQCVLQHDVANPHVSTHMATPDDNNHTAITRVYCYVMSSLTPQSHTTLH